MKNFKKSFSYPIIFMILITAFFTLILSLLNYSTKDVIAQNAEIDEWKTLLYVFDINYPENNDEKIEELYKDHLEKINIDDTTIYEGKKDGEELGFAFPVEGDGLWGTIRGYAAVDKNISTLLGVDFVSHSETPGLGGRIDEMWFKDQFRNIELDDNKDNYLEYRPAADGNVDSISGATGTSRAVKDILNEDIEEFKSLMKGEDLNGK